MKDLLILVYADETYEKFVVPYIYYALKSNPTAVVEVVLDNCEDFKYKNQMAIKKLNNLFEDRFLLRQSIFTKNDMIPNTIRFVDSAKLEAKYLYIGDIDIIIFEDLKKVHLEYIDKYNLPFSNVLRERNNDFTPERLTGLHFCEYKKYYPLPDISDLNLKKLNDEHVLYEIMKRNGHMVPKSFKLRPECGIHMSLSRDPLGRYSLRNSIDFSKKSLGWGGKKYYHAFLESISEKDYLILYPFFDIGYKYLALLLESIAKDTFTQLQLDIQYYGFDKRLIIQDRKVDFKEYENRRKLYIEAGDLNMANSITKKMISIWPKNVSLYFNLAWGLIGIGDLNSAFNVFEFISKFQKGDELLKNSNIFCKNVYRFSDLLKDRGLDDDFKKLCLICINENKTPTGLA